MKIASLTGVVLALTAVTVTAPAASAAPLHAPARHGSAHHAASQRIPFTGATVTAGDDGSYRIVWKAPGVRQVVVRAAGRVVARGGATGDVTVRGLPAADRRWFDLVPGHGGSLRLADRLIRLDGAVNFRVLSTIL
ncbi:hypothetical protein ACFYRN_11625 [Streptomyces sp. NPDC005227]|uniref:hypothetical protein n=1 Tax=Streptomyces sp. NPDC005227 TaxID=3364707 RepID=UPI0036A46DA6